MSTRNQSDDTEEHEKLPSGVSKDIKWLKIYIDSEMRAVRQAVEKVETTNKEAVDKVEKTNADYRTIQNEWRAQIKDQQATFATRTDIKNIETQMPTFVSRRELMGVALGVLTLLVSVIAILVSKNWG